MSVRDSILDLQSRIAGDIIGQQEMVEKLLIGLLANGNVLVEGLPGLAKTRAVKSLARHLDAELSRIQFTPDLLPSDVTGTEVYHQVDGKGEFRFEAGPIFANIVLADEINRAPAKVQAALLEAPAMCYPQHFCCLRPPPLPMPRPFQAILVFRVSGLRVDPEKCGSKTKEGKPSLLYGYARFIFPF